MILVSYISDKFIDLLSTGIVGSHHSVQGGVADRRVSVSDVNCDLLQGLGWSRLAYIHSVALD